MIQFVESTDKLKLAFIEMLNDKIHMAVESNYTCKNWSDLEKHPTDEKYIISIDMVTDEAKRRDYLCDDYRAIYDQIISEMNIADRKPKEYDSEVSGGNVNT